MDIYVQHQRSRRRRKGRKRHEGGRWICWRDPEVVRHGK